VLVPRVVMDVDEAAANEGVAPKAAWRNVAKLARSLAVPRQLGCSRNAVRRNCVRRRHPRQSSLAQGA
jgi:hypothetical protein